MDKPRRGRPRKLNQTSENRATEKKKLPRTAFKPGQSGNPGGRPKGYAEMREAAREHTADSIAALKACLSHPDGRVVVAAAVALLNRGWGQPGQSVEVTGKDGEPLKADLTLNIPTVDTAQVIAILRGAGVADRVAPSSPVNGDGKL